jgi:hypothetical protein
VALVHHHRAALHDAALRGVLVRGVEWNHHGLCVVGPQVGMSPGGERSRSVEARLAGRRWAA